jgi:hypothetical protein
MLEVCLLFGLKEVTGESVWLSIWNFIYFVAFSPQANYTA